MIGKPFQNLLYSDSPFMASSNGLNKNVEHIFNLVKKTKISLLHGVCHELCNVAENLTLVQIQEYDWIKKSFKCSVDDLDWFFLGYTTPPTIIISACLMESTNIKKAIQILSTPIKDKRMTELNRYKVKYLLNVFSITTNHLPSKLSSVFNPIYKILNNMPFSNNHYYLTGIESSMVTAIELSKIVESHLIPFQ